MPVVNNESRYVSQWHFLETGTDHSGNENGKTAARLESFCEELAIDSAWLGRFLSNGPRGNNRSNSFKHGSNNSTCHVHHDATTDRIDLRRDTGSDWSAYSGATIRLDGGGGGPPFDLGGGKAPAFAGEKRCVEIGWGSAIWEIIRGHLTRPHQPTSGFGCESTQPRFRTVQVRD